MAGEAFLELLKFKGGTFAALGILTKRVPPAGHTCRQASCGPAVFRCQMPSFKLGIVTRSTGQEPARQVIVQPRSNGNVFETSALSETSIKPFQIVVLVCCCTFYFSLPALAIKRSNCFGSDRSGRDQEVFIRWCTFQALSREVVNRRQCEGRSSAMQHRPTWV